MTNGVIGAFGGWGMLTLTTAGNGGDRYCVLHDNVNNTFHNHLAVGANVFSGWSMDIAFRGDLPSNHLANITQSGIYNMAGIQVDDGPYPIQWGQLVVRNTGGVINQEIHDSSGTIFTRSINSWGIVGWNTNKH